MRPSMLPLSPLPFVIQPAKTLEPICPIIHWPVVEMSQGRAAREERVREEQSKTGRDENSKDRTMRGKGGSGWFDALPEVEKGKRSSTSCDGHELEKVGDTGRKATGRQLTPTGGLVRLVRSATCAWFTRFCGRTEPDESSI